MPKYIKPHKVIRWNIKAGNSRGDVDYDLEMKLLREELDETYVAMQHNDCIAVVDGIIDLMVVAIGTLHKMGMTEDDIVTAFNEIMESNNTKIPLVKDNNGKIVKGEQYKPPRLENKLWLFKMWYEENFGDIRDSLGQ